MILNLILKIKKTSASLYLDQTFSLKRHRPKNQLYEKLGVDKTIFIGIKYYASSSYFYECTSTKKRVTCSCAKDYILLLRPLGYNVRQQLCNCATHLNPKYHDLGAYFHNTKKQFISLLISDTTEENGWSYIRQPSNWPTRHKD